MQTPSPQTVVAPASQPALPQSYTPRYTLEEIEQHREKTRQHLRESEELRREIDIFLASLKK